MKKTFTDPRDGMTYKTVKIGDLIWFAENLIYWGVEHYFPNGDDNNVPAYGLLYTWENAKKACPEGWRLPTKEECLTLIGTFSYGEYKDSSSIRDLSWSNGSNTSGFSALPAGFRASNGIFNTFGPLAWFWSATPCDRECAYGLHVYPDYANVNLNYANYAFSVRCVKDD